MHTLLCVCPPRVESLFPPVLSKSCSQILLAFKVWFSRNSSSGCKTPRLGNLTWGSEPSVQWVDFCGKSVLQFVSHPPSSYGFEFIVIVPLLWSHCGFSFVFGCGVSFLVSSSVFLSMIVPQLVVIPEFSQEWEHVLLLHHLKPILQRFLFMRFSSPKIIFVLFSGIPQWSLVTHHILFLPFLPCNLCLILESFQWSVFSHNFTVNGVHTVFVWF